MEGPQKINRRKFPRIKYPCLIVIRNGAGSEDKKNTLLTHTENVGVGGVCITLKENVKVFSVVGIELDLLDLEDHINCNGKVVWSIKREGKTGSKTKHYDVGIEFDNIKESEQSRLVKIVNRIEKNN